MPLSLRESTCRVRRLPRNEEVLMGRASLLLPADRDLIEAVFVRRQSTRSVARLMGLTTRTVRKRTRLLAGLLASRRFIAVARVLPYLNGDDVVLARLRFCAGLSYRKLCARSGLTPYHLRRRLDRILAQVATIKRVRNPEDMLSSGPQARWGSKTRGIPCGIPALESEVG